jgi:hypothetical protein
VIPFEKDFFYEILCFDRYRLVHYAGWMQ